MLCVQCFSSYTRTTLWPDAHASIQLWPTSGAYPAAPKRLRLVPPLTPTPTGLHASSASSNRASSNRP